MTHSMSSWLVAILIMMTMRRFFPGTQALPHCALHQDCHAYPNGTDGLDFGLTSQLPRTTLPAAPASLSVGISITISIPLPIRPSTTASQPPPSSITSSAASSSPAPTAPSSSSSSTSTLVPLPKPPPMNGQNAFEPVGTGPPPANIPSRGDHPVKPDHIVGSTGPIPTNKFFANFFLGSQTGPSFTHPYGVAWAKGKGPVTSYGLMVSNIELNQLAFGPMSQSIPGNPVQFYINPTGIQSMILSAAELGPSSVLVVSKPSAFSATILLSPDPGSTSHIAFPLVQGMGFVTAVYTKLQPTVQSGVFFRQFEQLGSPKPGLFKYRVTLEDGTAWLIYVTSADGTDPQLRLEDHSLIRGIGGFSGTIQICKNPLGGEGEGIYDRSAGVYAVEVQLAGFVVADQQTGTYSFSWEKQGLDVSTTPLLMFALPHHCDSFDKNTKSRMTGLHLRTTTKGMATGIVGDSWTMVETSLPISLGFAPWNAQSKTSPPLSEPAKEKLKTVAPTELNQDIHQQTYLDSMYFSGKGFGKFSMLVYTVEKLAEDPSLAENAFRLLKEAFAKFVRNEQKWPLVYDTVWKGIVSSGSYVTRDPGLDFGNTYYNDHHFHYGYFILSAAIMGTLDPSWIAGNKDWVNALVRDVSTPVPDDPFFPCFRSFDWYNGHSWAKGLFESYDGKDEESSSEDALFAYALKLWGKAIGDASMEARGNLMLAVLARSLHAYFLLRSDNVNHPANFIANKVTGILFENKVDHTTYFGTNLEYIQGIHMIPLTASSSYTRDQLFVKEEWEAMFAETAFTPASKVQGGWQGILFANLALIDPSTSWEFFSRDPFDYSKIDGGATRTWYLAFAAGLGGGPRL
ncbi:endo-1,3-beta-glucanase Engl1 [Histoplasma capsulatum G186AR]|nr:endo-1,3-beta-glucanase Engl1 [Histoplasma capsulatum]QSS67487.1 endo-1,3-beta-glucanase Engl1 [Histoplasma capsulatum G186AR]